MDDQESTFLAVTGAKDESLAKHFLELTNGDLEYAVTLYMESHHPQAASTNSGNDEEYAARLQQETYENEDRNSIVRDADSNIHRHETLVDNMDSFFSPTNQPRPTDIFGRGRVGIFNQRFDEEENDYYNGRISGTNSDEPYEDTEDEVMILDSDEEEGDRPRSRRGAHRENRQSELTSTQRRLANLFRPPFDLMSKFDIDTAKLEGRKQKKWILVNVQDSTEFSCQILNRDFWSNSRIKSEIKKSFIFLQYQNDSPNGITYLQFYSTTKFPHIAILDPLTGERVFQWTDGVVPDVEEWISDVEAFLSRFSLSSSSNNPMVEHPVKFDPDTLTEEQQIEFAMKQSMMDNEGTSESNAISITDSDEQENTIPVPTIPKQSDPFVYIEPRDHPEPDSGNTTRIQVRFPNGKRLVRKLLVDDRVSILYEWLKYILEKDPEAYGLQAGDKFTLSNFSDRSVSLIDSLDKSIQESNLKNASVLLEKE